MLELDSMTNINYKNVDYTNADILPHHRIDGSYFHTYELVGV